MANFRTDQFDNVPANIDRVGSHRGPKVKGRGWIGFAWAVLATAVLIVGGLYVLSTLNSAVSFPLGGGNQPLPSDTPSSTPTPEITPITDPASIAARHITITVLNGTDIVGQQVQAGNILKTAGWNVVSEANASESTIKTTTIYYSNLADEDVAEGIQSALGVGNISYGGGFLGSPITVVIGSDYAH